MEHSTYFGVHWTQWCSLWIADQHLHTWVISQTWLKLGVQFSLSLSLSLSLGESSPIYGVWQTINLCPSYWSVAKSQESGSSEQRLICAQISLDFHVDELTGFNNCIVHWLTVSPHFRRQAGQIAIKATQRILQPDQKVSIAINKLISLLTIWDHLPLLDSQF